MHWTCCVIVSGSIFIWYGLGVYEVYTLYYCYNVASAHHAVLVLSCVAMRLFLRLQCVSCLVLLFFSGAVDLHVQPLVGSTLAF